MTTRPQDERGADVQKVYNFKIEATMVCNAIGSKVGNMTVQCALREAFEAGRALGAASARETGGWQPISTAPKDGTLVLLGRADDRDWPLRCRRWENGHWRGHDADDATHWMPLPAAPPAGQETDR